MQDTKRSLVHQFLNDERGITDETLQAFGVTFEGNAALFDYGGGFVKQRIHDSDGARHYVSPKGIAAGLFTPRSLSRTGTCFIVEGESDALRLYQEFGGAYDVYGVPGVNAWKPEFALAFNSYDVCHVILDNDEDYKVAATVDRCWMEIRKALGRKAKRIRLPNGVNDLCEFFDLYDVDALRLLADSETPSSSWHYQALDLTKPYTEPDWLVKDLIAKGDLCMLIGEPGIGKSWITMALAVAVAEGTSSFLGRPLTSGSKRVLYVDEENPEALVPFRLTRLGLSPDGVKHVRYLHQQGIRVDRHPEYILEEALDYDPAIIVLDSLTRIHTKDENNAGEISALFNDGIVPLARATGATVVLLHHVNKTDSTSSFTRARGSSDLSGVIDTGLDLRGSGSSLTLHHYKSRWVGEGSRIDFKIMDTADGGVALDVRKPSF